MHYNSDTSSIMYASWYPLLKIFSPTGNFYFVCMHGCESSLDSGIIYDTVERVGKYRFMLFPVIIKRVKNP